MLAATHVAKFALRIAPRDALHRHHGLLLLQLKGSLWLIELIVVVAVLNVLQLYVVLVVMAHYNHAVGLRAACRIRDALLELHWTSSRRVRFRSTMGSPIRSPIRRQGS